MERYFIILFLIFFNNVYSQESLFKKHNLSLNLVSKLDLSEKFKLTDNKLSEIFEKELTKKNIQISNNDNRYFISISFGWKYKRSTELEIDNFKGFIVDTYNEDKVLAEFSSLKTKNLNESIEVLVSKLFYENERIGYDGKFIDISDHFQKMDIQSWDSSRPDSHSPAAIFTDHTHKKGGIMLGYKINLKSGCDIEVIPFV